MKTHKIEIQSELPFGVAQNMDETKSECHEELSDGRVEYHEISHYQQQTVNDAAAVPLSHCFEEPVVIEIKLEEDT